MKTIIDRIPLLFKAGQTVTVTLPEAFRLSDSLFLIIHNADGENLKVDLSNANGNSVTHYFLLQSFPAILVFPECAEKESLFLNQAEFHTASFTAYRDFEGSLTCRIKNPERVLASYRQEQKLSAST